MVKPEALKVEPIKQKMDKVEKLVSLIQQVMELEEEIKEEALSVITKYHKACDDGDRDLRHALRHEYHKAAQKQNALADWMINYTRGMLNEVKEWN